MCSQIPVEHDFHLPIVKYFIELGSFKFGDCGSRLFVEPADHKFLASLPIVFDLLPVAEVNKSGETFELVCAFH